MDDLDQLLSQYYLEGALLGELSPDEMERVQLLAGDAVLSDMLAALRASDREILMWYPPKRVAAEILRRFRAGSRSSQVRLARSLREPKRSRMSCSAVACMAGIFLLLKKNRL